MQGTYILNTQSSNVMIRAFVTLRLLGENKRCWEFSSTSYLNLFKKVYYKGKKKKEEEEEEERERRLLVYNLKLPKGLSVDLPEAGMLRWKERGMELLLPLMPI